MLKKSQQLFYVCINSSCRSSQLQKKVASNNDNSGFQVPAPVDLFEPSSSSANFPDQQAGSPVLSIAVESSRFIFINNCSNYLFEQTDL